jgi:Amidohydrolase family
MAKQCTPGQNLPAGSTMSRRLGRSFQRPLLLALLLSPLAAFSRSRAALQPGQSASTVAITDVAVIDVTTGTARPNQTVLIAGNRITAVGLASRVRVPRGATSVNGSGKYLMPGMWDLHSHAVMFGPTSLKLFLAHGVTGVRDMGAERFAVAKAWRDSIAAGSMLGPRMRIASPIVENAGWLAAVKQMGEAAGTPWTLYERFGPTSAEDAVRWVDSVAALGPDHIKVRNWPAPEIGRALLARARERGIPVVAHPNEPFPRSGVTTFEHYVWPPPGGSQAARDSLWRQLARSGTQFVPTLVTRVIRSESPDALLAKLNAGRIPGLQYVPAKTRERWRHQLEEIKQEQPMDWAAIQRSELRNLGEMRRAGIALLTGTDVGAPLIVPGVSLHDELAHLVNTAGLTTRQALEAATIGAARIVGMADSVGTIDSGKLADLVLLDANPLTDIANTRRIRAVITNGRLLDRRAIDALLADVEKVSRP